MREDPEDVDVVTSDGGEAGPDDGALVRRARAGDERAFETLVRRYMRAGYAQAVAIVSDAGLAEDALQNAMVLAWQRLHQCRDPDRFAAWFLSIARRSALKLRRRHRTRREVALDGSELPPSPADGMMKVQRADLRRALLDGLQRLTDGQRNVLLLHDLEGMRHRAIGEALGLSEVMSRRLLSDARRRMREILADDAPELLS